MQIGEVRAVGARTRLQHRRVDLGQQIALLHAVADLDMHLLELAGDLCADIDIILGLQGAEGGHRLLDVAGGHRCRLESRGGVGGDLAVADGARRGDQRHGHPHPQQATLRAPRRWGRDDDVGVDQHLVGH